MIGEVQEAATIQPTQVGALGALCAFLKAHGAMPITSTVECQRLREGTIQVPGGRLVHLHQAPLEAWRISVRAIR